MTDAPWGVMCWADLLLSRPTGEHDSDPRNRITGPAGLRYRRDHGGIHLHRPGRPTRITLTGFPAHWWDHVTRSQTTGRYFYPANGGNAVNFIHGAGVGPFIFLVQAEILAAIRMLTRGDLAPGIHEVPAPDREATAATWLSYFNR
ncbi:hypothetical protein ABZ714_26350 [Streptomyces sp. NPDC006798]|uniref:hypothetical protein n=1 Tax=Streptomyces sp. NPDC006798 TaxID=3155462 RepID=UPI0033F42EF3